MSLPFDRRTYNREWHAAKREETRAHPGNACPPPPPAFLSIADRQRALLRRLFGADWQRAEVRIEQLAARNAHAGGVRQAAGE